MRVLIADDDEYFRGILQRMLEAKGFEVVVCTNGADVLASEVLRNLPQLLLLDWVMPEMTGIEVINRLRATPHLSYTYVILLTAKYDSDDLLAGLRAGVNDYIIKPFAPETFESRVKIAVQTIEMHNTMTRQRADLLAATRLATIGE